MSKTKTQDLKRYRDLDVESVTMRVTTGEDTMESAARCVPIDGTPIDMNIFGVTMRQQTIAQAVVGFTPVGKAPIVCSGPCIESVQWSSRTREFLGEMYDYMNGITNDEREDFRKALAGSA